MAASVQVSWGTRGEETSGFPCVDCGLLTGNFCDGSPTVGFDKCFAHDRVPQDYPVVKFVGFRTPLCTYCETCSEFCRFCRGLKGCTPPTRIRHWSGVPPCESREFTAERATAARRKEFEIREQLREAPISAKERGKAAAPKAAAANT